MKNASPELIALLNTGSFVKCTLYTITLFSGEVLRYTDADVDITDGTNVWSSQGPKIDNAQSKITGHWKIGVDVDTWATYIMPRPLDLITGETFPDKIGTIPWLEAAVGGALDDADVAIDRAYLDAWPTPWKKTVPVEPTGIVRIFTGTMAAVDIGRTYAILNINSLLDRLATETPRNLYQSQCRHTLFDSGCQLVADDFKVEGTVGNGTSTNAVLTDLPQVAGYFDLGRIVMTSGKNNTFSRQIRSWDGMTLRLIAPFPFPLVAGDTFNIYPGCDKMKSTCTDKFDNLENYGGQDFIPAPETSI